MMSHFIILKPLNIVTAVEIKQERKKMEALIAP
jgi:hypothetical protein